ncbi:MAG: tRNA uridine-5-carboxymethylaminomethyl(34) synthesis GTPase MnmE [Pelagibacteraceae bacterium]|nr:MAG: tRNA uridine-5-carboxymethylaminomethyl(34) synthesis GTPase MnmE [Pelagibacteraceae bacterium]
MSIFALATAPGTSGLAVIRVSGKEAFTVARTITKFKKIKPRIANFSSFYDSKNQIIDKGIFIFFPKPNSYTGDDVVEFHIHGSNAVVKYFIKVLSELKNCRLAKPGEFTKTALLNKKINLLQAESLIDLINSETELQRIQALKVMNEDTTQVYNNLRDELIKILSDYEAVIDFSDDEVGDNVFFNNRNKLLKINDKIKKIIHRSDNSEKIREGFRVSIIGPTNSGKSSLINCLANRPVSIVSNIPGTTRDLIEASILLDGKLVRFFDTAGLRNSKNIIEKKGISLTNKNLKNSDLKLIIFDHTKKVDKKILKLFDSKSILVLNKIDIKSSKIFLSSKIYKPIKISAKKNIGISNLVNSISKKINDHFKVNEDNIISRQRHVKSLENTVFFIQKCLKKNSINQIDLAAEDLRLAVRNLGEIVGFVNVEELLDKIFKDFCIGK